MTDTFTSQTKAPGDLRMLAQVEQWMATIREIDREERAKIEPASSPARAPAHPRRRVITE
jgi:hypothetical protein